MKIDIITCPQWGARQPRHPIITCGKSKRVILHHTAGHHAEIENRFTESVAEAMKYARAIQNYHMDHNGWNDSGQNFLICRNGSILQGRWLTVSTIEAGHMVISAHCPGQNDQIGIEHEHMGVEEMTQEQFDASALLQAWIANQYNLSKVLPIFPHSDFISTSCPVNLKNDIPELRAASQKILNRELAAA